MLTIGEFAKMCGTTVQTLHVYDRKDILKPVAVGEQGYRYYDPIQVYLFHTIVYMKRCGLSLKEISDHLHESTVADFFLRDSEQYVLRQIEELQQTLRHVRATQYFFEQIFGEGTEVDPMLIDIFEDVLCLATKLPRPAAADSDEFSRFFADHLERYRNDPRWPTYPMAFVVATEGTTANKFLVSHVMCLPYPERPLPKRREGSGKYYTVAKGQYVLTRYSGPSKIPLENLMRMHRFVRRGGLRVCGDSVVITMVSGVNSEDAEQYACAVLMPVEKK